MAKRPNDSPTEKGQRVTWRGRGKVGYIDRIDGTWVFMKWDDPEDAPFICHVNELALVA